MTNLSAPTSSSTTSVLQSTTVASRAAPLIDRLFEAPPARFVFWDGSALGPEGAGSLVFRSPRALRRLLWSPDELGLARCYVTGDVDLDGDIFTLLRVLALTAEDARRVNPALYLRGLATALRLGALGLPPRPPAEEVRLSGLRHSRGRDRAAIAHHYDVGDDFYRLVLGPTMTYSCARFVEPTTSLDDAQRAKHELICRKLGLHERPGARLLDVGCGWGEMAIHAARHHGAHVTAITLSAAQAERARSRVREEGVEALVEVRLQDYRDLDGERFDAISSVGMFEHVGHKMMDVYFTTLARLLAPMGRLLNHAISHAGSSKMEGRKFIHRYVFPDGELIDVAVVASAMERAGFEVRDVESLREHYARTLHEWIHNLEGSWNEAVALVGEERARVWKLYMAGSANAFERGRIAIHQVLGIRAGEGGRSGMPATRVGFG